VRAGLLPVAQPGCLALRSAQQLRSEFATSVIRLPGHSLAVELRRGFEACHFWCDRKEITCGRKHRFFSKKEKKIGKGGQAQAFAAPSADPSLAPG